MNAIQKTVRLIFYIMIIGGFYLIILSPFPAFKHHNYQYILIIGLRFSVFFWYLQLINFWYHFSLGKLRNKALLAQQYSNFVVKSFPKVAIIVPIKDEPEMIVRRMIRALNAINYDNLEIFIVDNYSENFDSSFLSTNITDICHHRFQIIKKRNSIGFKAGALNFGLKQIQDDVKYLLILDADHAPCKNIMQMLVPILEEHSEYAFVQAPQRFKKINRSVISKIGHFQQMIFFDFICQGMSETGSLFLTGTNFLIRKNAVDQIQGFDELSITEDLRTSLLLNKSGFKGVFTDQTVAYGYQPSSFKAYYKQQKRWAIGTFQNFWYSIKLLFQSPLTLTFDQWLQYLILNGTWYFQGFVNLYVLLSTSILLFSGTHYSYGNAESMVFILFMTTLLSQIFYGVKRGNMRIAEFLITVAIYFGNSAIFMKAFFQSFLKSRISFEVTDKSLKTNNSLPLLGVFYNLSVLVLLIFNLGWIFYYQSFPSLIKYFWIYFLIFQTLVNLFLPLISRTFNYGKKNK